MEYKIIEIDKYELQGAEQKIELLLSKGWKLHGSLAAVTGDQYLYQALIRDVAKAVGTTHKERTR